MKSNRLGIIAMVVSTPDNPLTAERSSKLDIAIIFRRGVGRLRR